VSRPTRRTKFIDAAAVVRCDGEALVDLFSDEEHALDSGREARARAARLPMDAPRRAGRRLPPKLAL
jgi:hypothetical protein